MADPERERAEVFDALGHPTRINILKQLSRGALSFADLKKTTGIGSSGHLQHHLTKLDGLIKADNYGNYCLSDAGNDALFVMQAIKADSRKGRLKSVSYGRKSRMLLTTIVVALTVCLVVPTLYLSSVSITLTQYVAQNQYVYVCDIMTGSLEERGSLKIGESLLHELAPQEWFNYTAVVISELNASGHGYALSNCATVDVFSPPVLNDTYYKQGFLTYKLEVYGPNGGDVYYARMYPIIGPDGWNRQVVSPFHQEIPPYPTIQASDESTGTLSGGVPYSFVSIVPISTFGNYTFCVRNEGNTTMQISFTITTPVVTLETKPLEEGSYPAWSPVFAEERIVRIRQLLRFTHPLPTVPMLLTAIPATTLIASNATTSAMLSTIMLAVLSIFMINRKRI